MYSSRWVLAAVLGLAACSRDVDLASDKFITRNDFENMAGWMPASPALTTERAHSGRYSTFVSQEVEYSLGYIAPLGQASSSKVKKLRIKAWALLTGGKARPDLVVQVLDPAQGHATVFLQSLDMHQQIKTFNTWTKVRKEFELPEACAPTHELRVFMARGSSSHMAFLDDVEITHD